MLHLRDADTASGSRSRARRRWSTRARAGSATCCRARRTPRTGTVYLSWAEAGDGGSGAAVGRARLDRPTADEPSLEDLEVIWRQTPKTDGDGHFSHRLAFAPDGEHLFVSSGDRQLKEPGAGHEQHPGHDRASDPRRRPGRRATRWRTAGGVTAEIWSCGPPQPARPRVRARRHAVVLRDGSRGRRRAQPGRGRVQLRVAGGVQRQRLRRRGDPRPRRG